MKIVIFGATGRTGLPLVRQALDAGFDVVVFVRDPTKMSLKHALLSLVQGDVMNAAAVERAITPDVDAVISVLSPLKESPKDLLPVAAQNIIAAMKQQNVKRLIYMTGAGVDMPQDKPRLIDHVIKFMLRTMAGDVLAQSVQAVRLVESSGLDWTILRAPMLNDKPHSGQYRVGWVGINTGPRLSRADAADFMLKQISSAEYVGKAPVLSN